MPRKIGGTKVSSSFIAWSKKSDSVDDLFKEVVQDLRNIDYLSPALAEEYSKAENLFSVNLPLYVSEKSRSFARNIFPPKTWESIESKANECRLLLGNKPDDN